MDDSYLKIADDLELLNQQIDLLQLRLEDGETVTLEDVASKLGDYSEVIDGLRQRLIRLNAPGC
ncbi:MAG: hypothetical protein ACREAB_01585 [Blastocatellia bacterium]